MTTRQKCSILIPTPNHGQWWASGSLNTEHRSLYWYTLSKRNTGTWGATTTAARLAHRRRCLWHRCVRYRPHSVYRPSNGTDTSSAKNTRRRFSCILAGRLVPFIVVQGLRSRRKYFHENMGEGKKEEKKKKGLCMKYVWRVRWGDKCFLHEMCVACRGGAIIL